MALSPAEEVTVAEIVERSLSFVRSVTLEEEQIERLREDLDLWDANKNSVKVELSGEVIYRAQPLLDAIRRRVRRMYGLEAFADESGMGSTSSFAIPNIPVF